MAIAREKVFNVCLPIFSMETKKCFVRFILPMKAPLEFWDSKESCIWWGKSGVARFEVIHSDES